MENVSENMNSKKDEFKLYLRKNPSILIALVSAAVTIISVIIGYAGRLSNIAYLKYWNIDELYAALETKKYHLFGGKFYRMGYCSFFYQYHY